MRDRRIVMITPLLLKNCRRDVPSNRLLIDWFIALLGSIAGLLLSYWCDLSDRLHVWPAANPHFIFRVVAASSGHPVAVQDPQ